MKQRPKTVSIDGMDQILAAFRRGKMLVVTDDERRENEGDLVIAADHATPQAINFMITHGRGLVCVAMDAARLNRLGLSRMPQQGGGVLRTAFMESVDARKGTTTGISAFDRAQTIKVLMSERSIPEDLIRPGHIFPLEAVSGGVLQRPGHTEAAVDLARIAGCRPAGVICEILGGDGRMARAGDLRAFARRHGLPMTSVASIAAYRKRTEKLVAKEQDINFPTEFGVFRLKMYRSAIDDQRHLALVIGNPAKARTPLVRVHSECLTGDAFGSLRCDCGSQLREGLKRIAESGHGVLLYMRQEGRGIGLEHKIHAYALQDRGYDTVEANIRLGFEPDLRDYAIAAQILSDLGVQRLRLLTNNPAKITGLEAYGVRVIDRLPLVIPSSRHNQAYLRAKARKLGHILK